MAQRQHAAAPRAVSPHLVKTNILGEPVHQLAHVAANDTTQAVPQLAQALPVLTTQNEPIDLILLGTGASAAVPDIRCVTSPATGCAGCLKTLEVGGEKNVRGNTGAIIRAPQPDGTEKTIMIDCGKTFREQALKLFPKHGLRVIDALLLTHLHADAVDGLDDLRAWTYSSAIQTTIPVYCTQVTYSYIEQAFPFLVNKGAASGSGKVAALSWHIFDPRQVLIIHGLRITPLPVHHGVYYNKAGHPPLICCGFLIDSRILYMSDVSYIPDWIYDRVLANELELPDPESGRFTSTTPKMKPRLLALIIDGNSLVLSKSHWGLPQALEMAHLLGADRTYLTDIPHGTSHECWAYACREFSRGRVSRQHLTNLRTNPKHRHKETEQQSHDHTYRGIENRHVEDFELFTERALESIEEWFGGPMLPRKVWPACDGMTISWFKDRVWDSEYHS